MPHRSQAGAKVCGQRVRACASLSSAKKTQREKAIIASRVLGLCAVCVQQYAGQGVRRVCSSMQGRGTGACQARCAGCARVGCMGMCLPQLGKKPIGKKPSSRHGSLAFPISSHPTPSHPISSHPIPSHPSPCHPIPSNPCNPIPSHAIPSHPIPSHPIPSHPTPSHLIPSHWCWCWCWCWC